jgi:transposase
MPARYGKWQTVYNRFRRWSLDGTWERILDHVVVKNDAVGDVEWIVSVDPTIVRAHQHAAGAPHRSPKELADRRKGDGHINECPPGGRPAVEGLGRSRGGLSSKIHLACDGRGRPLSIVLIPGQAHDGRTLGDVLGDLKVGRDGPGRPRTRPDHVIADKAYSSRAIREELRRRGIAHTIPEKKDPKANRHRRGSAGGRPPAFDKERYKDRNVVERCFNRLKQWRALATRYTKRGHYYRNEVVLASIMIWLAEDPRETP